MGIFKVSIKVRNFLDGVGLSFKDLLNFLFVVITAIIAFLVIFLFKGI